MQYRYGALFDMDGVIVDSATYHILAFEEWCREKNAPFDLEHFRKHSFGRQNRDIFRDLLGRELSPEELKAEDEHKEDLFRQVYSGHVEPLKGLIHFLAELRASGFGIAVATSGPPANVEFTLEAIGAKDAFDAVITSREVKQGKPNPQVFLTAAEALGLAPKQCAVFEDSRAGAQAAVASGALLIGVATGHSDLNGAAKMIEDFTQITAADVARLIDTRE
ncbi:MAG TPA: HAD family phosphatase [Armatimonadota bacterium]|jgi:HAD superfamily hydrolase (TIGR01509 family)